MIGLDLCLVYSSYIVNAHLRYPTGLSVNDQSLCGTLLLEMYETLAKLLELCLHEREPIKNLTLL